MLYTTEEIPGNQRDPKWGYHNIHTIEELTKEVVEDLQNGNISFMVYAYPPARANMAQNDGGKAALKRRMTKLEREDGASDL